MSREIIKIVVLTAFLSISIKAAEAGDVEDASGDRACNDRQCSVSSLTATAPTVKPVCYLKYKL